MERVNAEELIRLYELAPHPEGGYFREMYGSEGRIPREGLPPIFNGSRRYSTAILFLLPRGSRSCLHRLRADELWHFYLGDPLRLVELWPDGTLHDTTMGPDVRAGHKLQHAVPAGAWFGAFPGAGGEYCLVGCTVAPGFEMDDFEMGSAELFERWPHARSTLEWLLP